MPPLVDGEQIEVIIRYRGVEYQAATGGVVSVNVERHIQEVTGPYDMYRKYEPTGRKTLTIEMNERN